MYTADVRILLKKGVADPEGANTLKTLKLLGFDHIRDVHTVKTFSLTLEVDSEAAAKEEVEQACQRLLTNPVIHEYTYTLKPLGTALA